MVLAGPGYQHAQSDTLCPFRPSSLTIVEHTGPTRLPLLSGKSIELKTVGCTLSMQIPSKQYFCTAHSVGNFRKFVAEV